MQDQLPADSAQNQGAPTSRPEPTFLGNANDLTAVVSAASAGILLLCCATGGYGMYCLPIVPIVLGLLAVMNANQSVDPVRTRRWGWISVGVGGAIFVFIIIAMILLVLLYAVIIYLTIQAAPSGR
jgi:hypothetical protein